MTFTIAGVQNLIFMMGSFVSGTINPIEYYELGIGSATSSVTDTTLVNGSIRLLITGSPNFTEARKVLFQVDANSIQMSGIHLTEFGLFASGTVSIGSIYLRENFGSIIFDGTNEIQITTTVEGIAS